MTAKPPGIDTIRRNYPLLLRRMERLMAISQTLTSTFEHHKLLRVIIEAARELSDAEAASIMLADPETGELRFEATTNIEASQMEGLIIPVKHSVAGWIFLNSQPLVVPDTSRDSRWHRAVDDQVAFVTRSILGVPLIHREKTIGVLQTLNRREGTFNNDDITTLQALAAQAAVAIVNARLFQQSDQIAEMVHELRQPLNAIGAATALLMRPDLPGDKRTLIVQTVKREAERLAAMTTDFLDMARLESGRIRFVREPFDLPELMEECLEVVRAQAAARGLSLHLEAAAEPRTVVGDRGKVKQVILNLLTNGVKYNREQGELWLRSALETDGPMARISVTDTGRGIPADAMKHMFQKFYRVPETEAATVGTGLGLPIAKKMVEVMGGDMLVESTVGEGSTFYFTLPIESTT